MIERKLDEVDKQVAKYKIENTEMRSKKSTYEAQLSWVRLEIHELNTAWENEG